VTALAEVGHRAVGGGRLERASTSRRLVDLDALGPFTQIEVARACEVDPRAVARDGSGRSADRGAGTALRVAREDVDQLQPGGRGQVEVGFGRIAFAFGSGDFRRFFGECRARGEDDLIEVGRCGDEADFELVGPEFQFRHVGALDHSPERPVSVVAQVEVPVSGRRSRAGQWRVGHRAGAAFATAAAAVGREAGAEIVGEEPVGGARARRGVVAAGVLQHGEVLGRPAAFSAERQVLAGPRRPQAARERVERAVGDATALRRCLEGAAAVVGFGVVDLPAVFFSRRDQLPASRVGQREFRRAFVGGEKPCRAECRAEFVFGDDAKAVGAPRIEPIDVLRGVLAFCRQRYFAGRGHPGGAGEFALPVARLAGVLEEERGGGFVGVDPRFQVRLVGFDPLGVRAEYDRGAGGQRSGDGADEEDRRGRGEGGAEGPSRPPARRTGFGGPHDRCRFPVMHPAVSLPMSLADRFRRPVPCGSCVPCSLRPDAEVPESLGR
jgi:hypothetical protein